ncbi:ABC transporter A family member 7-like [Castanea sativa]|uniref:ABC transporter A family member 7-like n=1 Tax=Castanea sativa TaxID=21020 RepID=UPI003F652F1D
MFTNVQTVTAVAYICLFGTGFLGYSLFQILVENTSFPKFWIVVMELYPGFSLYCFLLEFAQIQNTSGIEWRDLNNSTKGMREVLIIMLVEWFAVFIISYYIDQIKSRICGKSPWSFLQNYWKKPSFQSEKSNVQIQMEEPEVRHEREKVEQLLLQQDKSNAVICYNLKKVYPAKNGNPEKLAVRNLSLAFPLGECFGMIGLNDSGKTTFINMVTGLTNPTSGKAFIHGLDIRTQMYTSMGVCLQHDLLWETLTGREHLLFYGRLRKLRGRPLTQAVEKCLKTANLSYGKVSYKQVGKYSKGMKRRLSVAIALIGDPKVIFIDELSIGLDLISRRNLWSVVKLVKQDRTIILTSHSTEEVENLCDRVGILINGSLQCIGNPKEVVHYFNESLDKNLRITRDTCSKDLFEMYRALNLL